MSRLLVEAPVGSHLAQFHRDARTLGEAVNLFVHGGLRRGNSVVVIATPAHTELFLDGFAPAVMDAKSLELFDVETLLTEFMRDGMPDGNEFRRTMAGVFERVKASGRGTRVYVETADLLWQRGQHQAAIRLEELWNELARVHSFALFCSYMLDPHCEKSYAGPLEEIGRTHSDIPATAEDERFSVALDAAGREMFGISLSQMAGFSAPGGAQRFPAGQRTMLWVKRNLPSSTAALAERARRHYGDTSR